jgi:hypothetical protein
VTQPEMQFFAFLLTPVVTLLIVLLGVFWQNRHVDVRISDLQQSIQRQFELQDSLFTEKLLRVEQVLDARLKLIADKLGIR